jgi:hypothetical protein
VRRARGRVGSRNSANSASMTDQELQQYAGQQVELKLVSGVVLTGKLMVEGDARTTLGMPYAIKSLHRSATVGLLESSYEGFPDAAAVEWVRILEQQPDNEQLFD